MSDGSHYANIYVGVPPQRVSVIIDTGSHFTAFPCVGCSTCSTHIDPPFDYIESSTYSMPRCDKCVNPAKSFCEDDKCIFAQHYAEGSSWEAVQVEDNLYIGGYTLEESTIRQKALSIYFVFGCHRKETGLFVEQVRSCRDTPRYKCKFVEGGSGGHCYS